MEVTTVPVPSPQGVLTAGFPSGPEFVRLIWSTIGGWAGAHLLLVVGGVAIALVWYVGIIVRRAVVSV